MRHDAAAEKGRPAAHAELSRKLCRPGYYVVNPLTDIAVAGPFGEHATAQRLASERNAEPPVAADALEVRLIGPSKVPVF